MASRKAPVRKTTKKAGARAAAPARKHDVFPIVGIGASAGGLEAFRQLLNALSPDSGLAYVLVQHLDPAHKSVLPELLSTATAIPVREVKDIMVVQPDHVYVIPPNTNMAILHGTLRLLTRTLSHGQHMPIDFFFRSLAEDRGQKAIGVILSGTASDGVLGLGYIKTAGGITFAQDAESAKFGGMPERASAAGVVDFVLPPAQIAEELKHIRRHPYLRQPENAQDTLKAENGDLNKAFILLRDSTGVDFSYYKQSTLLRRIKRRMALHKVHRLKEYVKYLGDHPKEVRDLFNDFLIHVTGFFRDPPTFEALEKEVFPHLLERSKSGMPIRIWVPGCSTGEEVYSIAICLLEYLSRQRGAPPLKIPGDTAIQIIGSDISGARIATAREGAYPLSISADVSASRLRDFFVRLEGAYQVAKPVREMCLFSEHNMLKAPPFSKLDLVSCRNVMIYLGNMLQKRLIPTFHFALKPDGYLMLGHAEGVSGFSDLFNLVDKKHKIYKKKAVPTRMMPQFVPHEPPFPGKVQPERVRGDVMAATRADVEADRLLLSKYVPPSVILNDHLDILQFRGNVGRYLEPPSGEATLNVAKLARPDLVTELRFAIGNARKSGGPVVREKVGRSNDITLEIIPVGKTGTLERHFLVLFHEEGVHAGRPKPAALKGKQERMLRGSKAAAMERMSVELQQSRDQLEAVIEEQEVTNEELKSANEEIMSSNEELQSTNEELETAKEELQSGNEELTTLNEELQKRNLELSAALGDVHNLLNSANIPLVMLSNQLRIRHFTPQAKTLLNLLPTDLGRRLGDLKSNLKVTDLEKWIQDAIDTVSPRDLLVEDQENRWYLMRVRPYKTEENRIDGAVLAFLDVDPLKRQVDQSRLFAAGLIENSPLPMVVLDEAFHVRTANGSYCRMFSIRPEEVAGQSFFEVHDRCWSIPQLYDGLETVLKQKAFDTMEVEVDCLSLGRRTMHAHGRLIEVGDDKLILVSLEDVTEKMRVQHDLQELSSVLLKSQDLERRRLARELHDSTGQKVAALAIDLSILSTEESGLNDKARKALAESQLLAKQVSSEIRTLSYLLHPPLLEESGLESALKWLADGFSERSGIVIQLDLQPDVGRLPGDIETALFRIAQEALTNIQLHSGSNHASIHLARMGTDIELEVADDGRGIYREESGSHPSLGVGIRGMQERLKQFGGHLHIMSHDGGTTVVARVPVKEE